MNYFLFRGQDQHFLLCAKNAEVCSTPNVVLSGEMLSEEALTKYYKVLNNNHELVISV